MFSVTHSLRGRLAIYFALAIIASLLFSGLLSVSLVQRYLQQKTVSDLKSQAESLAQQVESEGLPNRRYINDLERTFGTRALIVPYHEQALNQLPQNPDQPDLTPSGASQFINWDQLGQGGTQVVQTRLAGLDRETIVVAHALDVNGQMAGAIVLAKPVQLLQSWQPLAGYFLIGAGVSLAISLLFSFLLARRLSRPLQDLTGAATAVAGGDFSKEVKVESDDEIGQLADAFRHMTGEVQKSQEQQRQFVINVSHELKTPLTAITGHTQALREGVATDPESIASSLKVIDAETRRLSRLIEDLLSLAKFDSHQFGLRRTMVPVEELSCSVVDSIVHQAQEKGIELKTAAIGDGDLRINADPDRLRQILSNLVHNALAHTPRGGRVTLMTRPTGERVQFEVTDNGKGIPPDELPHVFDRFYRGEGSSRGTGGLGLGLSISRELARAMGGDITAHSAGKGARFVVSLPR